MVSSFPPTTPVPPHTSHSSVPSPSPLRAFDLAEAMGARPSNQFLHTRGIRFHRPLHSRHSIFSSFVNHINSSTLVLSAAIVVSGIILPWPLGHDIPVTLTIISAPHVELFCVLVSYSCYPSTATFSLLGFGSFRLLNPRIEPVSHIIGLSRGQIVAYSLSFCSHARCLHYADNVLNTANNYRCRTGHLHFL